MRGSQKGLVRKFRRGEKLALVTTIWWQRREELV
jgi:hypothetical protein